MKLFYSLLKFIALFLTLAFSTHTVIAQAGQARVAVGAYHSVVLDDNGDVFTFGSGVWGELGHGPDKRMDIARLIEDPLLTGKTIVDIAISRSHMLLLTSEGDVLGAGDGNQFQMGSPNIFNSQNLTLITHAALDTATIIQVYAGEGFSFLISDKGTVFTMGRNLNGFLGTGLNTAEIANPTPLNTSSLNPGEKIIKMSTSINSRIFLTDQNNIYVTGENSNGQLGDGTTIGKTVVVPLSMHHFDGKTIKDINAAQGVHRIVTTDGSLYTLGNYRAAHGMGLVTADLFAPTLVTHPSLDGKAVSTVATMPSNFERTLLTTTDGLVYVAGDNQVGELGRGDFAKVDTAWTPIPATFFDNKAVVEVVTGENFSLFRTSDGTVYGTGLNAGTGYSGYLTRPLPINTTLLQGKTITKMVASAVRQALLLTSDGQVFMINTRKHTLGIFDAVSRYSIMDINTIKAVPSKISHPNLNGHTIVEVKAGGAMSYLLSSEGKVFSFGRAATGALGLGDSLDVYVPTLITHPNLDGVKIVDIAIGSFGGQETTEIAHALLLTDDGSLFAMGSNNAGQLGVGDQVNRHVPTPVTTNLGGKSIVKIAAGPHNSMAIASDGTVFLWGSGTADLMGFGNTDDLLVPTLASHINVGGKKIIDGAIGFHDRGVSLSNPHFLFLNEDNEVYGIGHNQRGQLGLGNTTSPMITPQPLSTTNLTGETIVALEAGYRSSQLRTESGKLFGWGRAQMVGFDVGTFTNYSTPTLVVGTDLDNRKVIAVRHGLFHGLTLLEDGSVLSFGNYGDTSPEVYGASGLGFINEGTLADDYQRQRLPTRIPDFSTYVSPVPTGNLALHLDAERMGFIRSGDLVNTWQNLANDDHHAVNPAPELRPTRVASAINNRPAMRFNGTNQYFVLPSTANMGIQNNDYEIFMVAQTASANTNLYFLLSASIEQIELHANGGIGARYIPNAGNYVDAGSTGDFTNGAPHLYNLRASDTEGVLAMNRGIVSVNAGNARTGTENAIPMGVRQGGDFYFNGDIAEVIIYNKVLTAEERTAVANYLTEKYNITVVAPTVQASNIQFSEISLSSLNLSLTAGNGEQRLIVARQGEAVSFTPASETTYAANADFSVATDLGDGNKVIYSGTGNSVSLSGLTPGLTYHFAAFEYNGSEGFESYLTVSPAVNSATTELLFSGGLGTEANPFQLTTPGDLHGTRDHLSAFFLLMNDINMDVAPYNTGDGWEPIGTDANPFTGSLNGNGHAIQNLFIQRSTNFQGLFGRLSGTVTNLELSDATISLGEDYVTKIGVLAGRALNATVSDVTVSGTITEDNAGSSEIGGLVGYVSETSFEDINVNVHITIGNGWSYSIGGAFGEVYTNTTVTNMHVTGNISSNGGEGSAEIVGGLGGYVSGAGILIENSTASGNVTGSKDLGGFIAELVSTATVRNSSATGNVTSVASGLRVGGFIGALGNLGATVENCFTTGTVIVQIEGGSHIGGFAGNIGYSGQNSNPVNITGSFSIGTVTSTGNNVGGFAGQIRDESTITNSYALGSVSGAEYVGGFVGRINGTNETSSIQNAYTIGIVTGNASVGGFAGGSNGTIINSYWNPEISGQETSDGGTARTLTELTQVSNFNGWDFSEVWQISEGATLPWLRDISGNYRTAVATLSGSEGWRLMANPIQDGSYANMFGRIWTQGAANSNHPGGASNIFTWATNNATNTTENWIAVADLNDSFVPGDAVFVYVFSDDNPDEPGDAGFPKNLTFSGLEASGTQNMTNRVNSNQNGWTLIGNPFASEVQWDEFSRQNLSNSVYVWNSNESNWLSWNGAAGSLTDGKIGAFHGFFVQTTAANPQLEIPESAKTIMGSPMNLLSAQQNQMNANLSSARAGGVSEGEQLQASRAVAQVLSLQVTEPGGLSDQAWFQFSQKGSLGRDSYDAYQLTPLSSRYLMLHSVSEEGIPLAINSLPELTEAMDIPVHFQTTQAGTFSLRFAADALPESWYVVFRDTETGQIMQRGETYQFTNNAAMSLSSQPAEKKAKLITEDVLAMGMHMQASGNATMQARFVVTIDPNGAPETVEAELPEFFALHQNYPNPFNPVTTISYALPEQAALRLEVFDVLGRRVAILVNEEVHAAGNFSVQFDASHLASGVYVYRLVWGNTMLSKKFTLLK